MSVGLSPTKSQIDSAAGSEVNELEMRFSRIERIKAWLDETPDATLEAAPYSYTNGEVAILKSAYSDLKQLIDIYRGGANLASAKDFRAFAKQLRGLGV